MAKTDRRSTISALGGALRSALAGAFPRARDGWIALGLFAVVFGIFFLRLKRSQGDITFENCALGADSFENLQQLLIGKWDVFDRHKHPLAIMAHAVALGPLKAAHMDLHIPIAALQAGFVALGSVAVFATLRLLRCAASNAALAVAAYLLCYSVAVVLGVTETFGFTLAVTALAGFVGVAVAPLAAERPLTAAAAAGVAAGLAGWAHLPAPVVVLLFVGAAWRSGPGAVGRLARLLVPGAAVALAVTALPTLFLALRKGFGWQEGYVEHWASLSNFARPAVVRDYLTSLGVFSVVAPTSHTMCRFLAPDLSGLAGRPEAIVAWLAFAGALAWGWARAARNVELRGVALACGAASAALLVFYLYFNPPEVLLYASQFLLFAVMAAAIGWNNRRLSGALLLVVVLLLGVANGPLLRLTVPRSPAVCCPPERVVP